MGFEFNGITSRVEITGGINLTDYSDNLIVVSTNTTGVSSNFYTPPTGKKARIIGWTITTSSTSTSTSDSNYGVLLYRANSGIPIYTSLGFVRATSGSMSSSNSISVMLGYNQGIQMSSTGSLRRQGGDANVESYMHIFLILEDE